MQYQQWTTRCPQWRCWSRSLNRPKKWQEPAALHSPSALSFSSAFGSRFGEQFIWLTETLTIVRDENLKFDTLLMIGNAYEKQTRIMIWSSFFSLKQTKLEMVQWLMCWSCVKSLLELNFCWKLGMCVWKSSGTYCVILQLRFQGHPMICNSFFALIWSVWLAFFICSCDVKKRASKTNPSICYSRDCWWKVPIEWASCWMMEVVRFSLTWILSHGNLVSTLLYTSGLSG